MLRALLLASILAAALGCPFAGKVDNLDLARAAKLRPGAHALAGGAGNIRSMLNKHLVASSAGPFRYPQHKACEDFTLEALDAMQQQLDCHASPELKGVYAGSDGRSTEHRNQTLHPAEQHKALAVAAAGARADEQVYQALQAGMCHVIAMQWVHHLSASARDEFRAANSDSSLPLLPRSGAAEHVPTLKKKGLHHVAAWLGDTVTCQIGHEAKVEARGTWTEKDFPTWPFEVQYNASGYGPYPFWAGPGPSGSLTGKGADITTYYSAVQNAERLDHASCSIASLGASADGPCTHLFVNGSWAFVYSKDESFCCMSSAPAQYTACHLTRPQRNFMDVMDYNGIIDYTSEDGLFTKVKAKKWSMHLTTPSDFFFWYLTDLDGKPMEQGEGPCDMYAEDGTRNCAGPPKMLFHQYHTASFQETTFDASTFTVPDVCLDAKKRTYCMVSPTNFCGGR